MRSRSWSSAWLRPSGRCASSALGFLMLTVAKVFVYDLGQLTGLYRILSFLALGASLIRRVAPLSALRPARRGGRLMTRVATTVAVVWLAAAVAAQAPADRRARGPPGGIVATVAVPAATAGAFVAVPVPPEVAARSQPRSRRPAAGRCGGPRNGVSGGRRPAAGGSAPGQPARWPSRGRRAVSARHGRRTSARRDLQSAGARDSRARLRRAFVVEGSTDGTTWLVVADSFWAFDRLWQGRPVHDTALDVPVTTARFVRITGDDRRPALRGHRSRSAAAAADGRIDVDAEPPPSRRSGRCPSGRATRRRCRHGFPVRRLEIDADDPAFARPV